MTEYRALRDAHTKALSEYHNMSNPTVEAELAESAAWDALVCFVESHGLNRTEFDPREGYQS